MPNVVKFPGHARASTGSGARAGYRSGRKTDRLTPVARSTSITRSAGTCPSSQRNTVLLFTPKTSARASSVSGGSLAKRYSRKGLELLITQQVARNATICQDQVAFRLNDRPSAYGLWLRMAKPRASSRQKHHIPDWAREADKSQAQIGAKTGANKGTVSRWFAGVIPSDKYIAPLAKFLNAPEPKALFHDPQEYRWLQSFREATEGYTPDEREETIRAFRSLVARRPSVA